MNPRTVALEALRDAIRKAKPKKLDPELRRDLTRGWLVPYLIETDAAIFGRWAHWHRIMEAGALIDEPIPEVPFCGGNRDSAAMKMLEKSLCLVTRHGDWRGWSSWHYFDYFLDWLLFGFGAITEEPKEPHGCEGASMRLYQGFSLETLMAWPYDYFGEILAENQHGRHRGFFPTPMDVCTMMVRMQFGEGEDMRAKTVCDPAAGTGRMLLAASNYSYRLYAVDIDATVLKALKVNGYCWSPWLVKPFPFFTDTLTPVASAAPAVEIAAQLIDNIKLGQQELALA